MNANNSVLNIKIENFDGPLDMLSELIKEQKMDITQVNLVDIVDQYCEFIEKNSEEIQINSAIEYLQIQANLILIKSKWLLRSQDQEAQTDFEFLNNKLLQRIIEYNKYKRWIVFLQRKIAKRNEMYSRKSSEAKDFFEEKIVYEGKLPETIELSSLMTCYNSLIEKYRFDLLVKKGLKIKSVPIQNVKKLLFDYVIKHKRTSLYQYIETIIKKPEFTINYFVVLFCALLDLTRDGKFILEQHDNDLIIEAF